MGKKKIETFELITNKNARNITYGKRYKGLIKKAMELSMLCNQQIHLSIYDESKEKMVIYSSSENVTLKEISERVARNEKPDDNLFEHYLDRDYHLFEDNKIQHVDKNHTHLGGKRLLHFKNKLPIARNTEKSQSKNELITK